MKNFSEKTVLITGGTQGLGAELTRRLDAAGAEVIVLGCRREFFEALGGGVSERQEFRAVDLGDYGQVADFASSIKGRKIDIILNNAGVFSTNETEARNFGEREKVLRTNLLGAINITEAVLPNLLLSEDASQILFINSIAGRLGFGGETGGWSTYNASKWGLRGYMMDLKQREELKRIKIGAIYPGGFESNIYENAGTEDSAEETHGQSWMMATETVADAAMFMLGQPRDANLEELVLTKFFG